MQKQSTFATVAIFTCLAFAFLPHTKADARAAPQCMGKMTEGKRGGDHKFVLVVPPEKFDSFTVRGFVKTDCRQRNTFATKVKLQMCGLAVRSNAAVDADFRRIYSITPREICEL